jgi:hypothetical protein
MENYEEEFSFYNFNSIIYFVKNNIIQIFLFILVFLIIYLVDHISNINNMLLVMQQQTANASHEKMFKKSTKSTK